MKLLLLITSILCIMTTYSLSQDDANITYVCIVVPSDLYGAEPFNLLCEKLAKWQNDKGSAEVISVDKTLDIKKYFVYDIIYNLKDEKTTYYFAMIPLSDLTGLKKDGKEPLLSPTIKDDIEHFMKVDSKIIVKLLKAKNIDDVASDLNFGFRKPSWAP